MNAILLLALCVLLNKRVFCLLLNGGDHETMPGQVELNFMNILYYTKKSVSVTWDAPSIGDEHITKYKVIYCEETGRSCHKVETKKTSAILRGLKAYRVYNVTVVAHNEFVEGEPSNTVRFRAPPSVPAAPPQNLTLQALNSTSITVSWDPPPVELQNGRIQGYTVQYNPEEKSQYKSVQTRDEEIVLHDLVAGEYYQVRVSGRTSVGVGKFSKWKRVWTPRIKKKKQCQPGWITVEDRCYYVSRDKANWFVASAACFFILKGGTLVNIDSARKNEEVKKLARESGRENFWIGVSDLQKNEHFKYTYQFESKNATFSDWSSGSPDPDDDKNCVQLRKSSGFKWHVTTCSNPNYFICEDTFCSAFSLTSSPLFYDQIY